MRFRVAPSDFAFLYDACRRCWWMKVHGYKGSGEALPAIFNRVDFAMKRFLGTEQYRALGVPVQSVVLGEEYVLSEPFEAHGVSMQVSGKRDRTVVMDDGLYGVIDHKLTHPTPETARKYARQLHGYEYALRRPVKGSPREVGYLGLVCFDAYDARFKVSETDCAIIGKLVSVPVELERARFEAYLDEMCAVAAAPLPEPDPACGWCRTVEEHARGLASLSPTAGASLHVPPVAGGASGGGEEM